VKYREMEKQKLAVLN